MLFRQKSVGSARVFLGALVQTLLAITCTAGDLCAEPAPEVGATNILAISPASFVERQTNFAAAESLRRGMEAQATLHRSAELKVLTVEGIQNSLKSDTNYAQALEVARQWALLGIEKYKALETKEAIRALEQSVRGFRRIHHQFIDPTEYSDALLYLALGYLEAQSDVARPLKLFEEMILLDRARSLRPGFYPQQVVQFYESARQSVQRTTNSGDSAQEAQDLGAATKAKWVLSGHLIEETENESRVLITLFDTSTKQFVSREEMIVASSSSAEVTEAANRLTSRIFACLAEPILVTTTVRESRGESRWSIELAMAYAAFLRFPESKVTTFGNYGAQFGSKYLLTEEFSIRLDLQILSSIRDYTGYLTRDFSTLRGFLGGELGLMLGNVRLASTVAFEVSSLGEIVICRNEPRIHQQNCNQKTYDDFGFLFGVNLGLRVSYRVLDSIDVGLSTDASLFLLPVLEEAVNFPVSTEFGVQYRF
jgi:hypothetical protein